MTPEGHTFSAFPVQATAYRQLLRLLPASLVHAHGDDMLALFCHHLEDARGSFRAWLSVWLAAVSDVARHGPRLPRRSIGAPDPRRSPRKDLTMKERLRALLATLGRDAAYGIRLLRKDWSFTLAATLILGLAIGANTAVFSFVDTYMLRPLPYPEAEQLALATIGFEGGPPGGEWVDGRTWETIREARSDRFQAAVYSAWYTDANLATGSSATTVALQRVGTGYFGALGVPPMLGREFTSQEDVPEGAAVCILSHQLWQRLFDGEPAAVGKSVLLRGEPHTIVGIMPRDFRTSATADLWVPLRPTTTGEGGGANYRVLLRLGADTSWEEADASLAAIGLDIDHNFGEERVPRLSLTPLQARDSADLRTMLLLLSAAVGMVLLIACVNVSGLLLARGSRRGREVATRMAIGGGRGSIIRQFVVESLVLAAAGGIVGLLLARGMVRAIELLGGSIINIWRPVSLDLRILLGTLGISLLTALVFGLAPALQASKVNIHDALRAGGRGVAGGARRWRKLMVVAEVTLSVVLLIAAGLLLRTFIHLQGLAPGFDPSGLVSVSVSLQDARYETREAAEQLFADGIERLRQLPATSSATAALGLPYQRLLNLGFKPIDFELDADTNPITNVVYVSPDYFETLGVPILSGRGIDVSDAHDSVPVAVVNQAFADAFFSDGVPVGHALSTAGADRQIVGLVGTVKQRGSFGRARGPVDDTQTIFIPVSQVSGEFLKLVHTWFAPSWIVRVAGDPGMSVPAIERALGAVDPLLPLASTQLLSEVQADAISSQRFLASLVALLAATAIALAAAGIYGLVASTVTEQRREIGIRLALGASAGNAIRVAALPSIRLALIGAALGIAGALAAGSSLRSMLWGVAPNDPWTYASVAVGLVAAATIASLIPAARAARVDPAQTLRVE